MKKSILFIVIIVVILLLIIGGIILFKPKGPVKIKETVSTNEITKENKTEKGVVNYTFETSLYNIELKVKYDDKEFKYSKDILKGNNFDIKVTVVDNKEDTFTRDKELINAEIFTVAGHDAMQTQSDLEVVTIIKIDEKTVITVRGYTENGGYLVSEIKASKYYNDVLDNLIITVENK